MIDSLANLLFRCAHSRLTRPLTPVTKAGAVSGETYVVCLDCGKQFPYDMEKMKMGKALRPTHEASVVPPDLPKPRASKFKLALWASAIPLGMVLGAKLKGSRRPGKPEEKRKKAG
ncbi:MAG TPA: hypothetical protein VEL76_21445 [Gemmataceae bacterium]|nr:hypothetical protein [Gemmataceae bacterium]